MTRSSLLFLALVLGTPLASEAQTVPPRAVAVKQEKLLPAEASPLYLGMPYKELRKAFRLSDFDSVQDGTADAIFFSSSSGFAKLSNFSFKLGGIGSANMPLVVVHTHKVQKDGVEVSDIVYYLSKIPDAAYIREIHLTYLPQAGLENELKARYGPSLTEAAAGWDLEWSATSPDGLPWNVRFRRKDSLLQLVLK